MRQIMKWNPSIKTTAFFLSDAYDNAPVGAIEGGHGLVGANARDLEQQLQATQRVARRVEAQKEERKK